MWKTSCLEVEEQIVSVDLGAIQLQGELPIPKNADLVTVAVGTALAAVTFRFLRQAGLATIFRSFPIFKKLLFLTNNSSMLQAPKFICGINPKSQILSSKIPNWMTPIFSSGAINHACGN